ncbi:uncharacterized protein PG986_014448 [Apiospora aurea]|uniref:Helicase C-terminal domain-containing protein n=1 Tax=Apiospora aurea TaxID=335848 RepID=A0ABR1PT07_9PEZI
MARTLRPTRLSQYRSDWKGVLPTRDECYSVIARSATFPTIARLWFTGGLTTDQLMAPTVNELASKVTMELTLANYDRHAALELLEDSPFWEHRRLLRAESPKYHRLHGRIKEMMALEEPEHLIIFALYPVTCLVTLLILLRDFPWLRITFMHAYMPYQGRHGKDGYSRQATLDALESREHPQVVLMTYHLGSVGFNLQEANWLTMLEEPNTHAHAAQAPARVHRKGQRRATHIEAFWDEVNLARNTWYGRTPTATPWIRDWIGPYRNIASPARPVPIYQVLSEQDRQLATARNMGITSERHPCGGVSFQDFHFVVGLIA